MKYGYLDGFDPAQSFSGSVTSGELASGSVQGFFGSVRNIASGTVGVFDFGSGAVVAGTIGSGAVVSGNVASGQLSTFHFASGARIDAAAWIQDGFFAVSELVSGGRCVAFNLSGNGVWIAQAGLGASGRMPAVGYAVANILSGAAGVINLFGRLNNSLFANSGNFFSGFINQNAYVGFSGEIVSVSGLSGIANLPLSGYVTQSIGTIFSASGLFLSPL